MVCKNARFRNGIWRFLFSDLLIFPCHNLRNTVDIRGDIGKGRKIAANDLVCFGKAHKIKQGIFHAVYAVTGKISRFIGNDPAREYPAQICLFGQIIRCQVKHGGRIHGKFHQTVTATGRLSSAEPNLQNIPVRVELGRMIRKVFVPEEGYVFVDADYSQIELRVLAHCSQDEQLIQAYREEADIHRITASQVFHIPFDEVTPLQR